MSVSNPEVEADKAYDMASLSTSRGIRLDTYSSESNYDSGDPAERVGVTLISVFREQ